LGAPVEVLGERHDLASLLNDAWGVCLFSDFEGVPFAVQEAMWAGRAVVLSDLPSLRWFAGESAAYVTDLATAAAALERLCDPAAASHAGEVASQHVRDLLTPDAPFSQLLNDYGHDRRGSGRRS
jgi:glycosyltransferase involved in cell wall biosynthesis